MFQSSHVMSSHSNYSSLQRMTTRRLIIVCCVANLAGLLVGYHLAVFSGILEMKDFASAMINDEINAKSKSMITASLLVGCLFGAVPAGSLCDKKGRRKALLLTCSFFVVSAAITIISRRVLHVIIGRLFAGFGYAIANIVCPMYTAELAPTAYRGLLVSLYQVAVNIGILVAQLCNSYFAVKEPWTGPMHLAFWIGNISLVAVWMIAPESPVWENGKKGSFENIKVEEGHVNTIEEEDTSDVSLFKMIKDESCRKRLMIGCVLAAAQQLTGINAVVFFGPALVSDILHMTGEKGPFRSAAIVGFGNLIATAVSMFVIERIGRRQLLLLATNPIMLSLVVLGLMRQGIIVDDAFIGLSCLLVFVFGYAFSYGPLTFVICSEIFPIRYRGIGMSTCSFVMFTFALLIGAGFLPMLEMIGGWVFFIFAGFVGLCGVFTYWTVPETRNLTLEEISQLFMF